jgi:hypothetical protein
MAFNYTLVVQEDRPTGYAPGTFWLKPSQGLLMIYFSDDYWHHIAAGKGNLSTPSSGTYYNTVTEINSNDFSSLTPENGDLLLQNGDAYWAYIGQWCPFGGS